MHDGNTQDCSVHRDTWLAVQKIVGSSDFLYVSDSKLCNGKDMALIAGNNGRFLTVMPRTPSAARAALTSSSLNGWMIASTFFTHSPGTAGPSPTRFRNCAVTV